MRREPLKSDGPEPLHLSGANLPADRLPIPTFELPVSSHLVLLIPHRDQSGTESTQGVPVIKDRNPRENMADSMLELNPVFWNSEYQRCQD